MVDVFLSFPRPLPGEYAAALKSHETTALQHSQMSIGIPGEDSCLLSSIDALFQTTASVLREAAESSSKGQQDAGRLFLIGQSGVRPTFVYQFVEGRPEGKYIGLSAQQRARVFVARRHSDEKRRTVK
jgi:hypothetical protein